MGKISLQNPTAPGNTLVSPTETLHELVRILHYQPLYTLMAGHTVAVFIMVAFLWNNVSHGMLLAWASFLMVQNIFWAILINVYRRRQPAADSARFWVRNFLIAGAIYGFSWGLTAFWSNILGDPSATVFLAIMVLGIVAAGLGIFAPYLRSYFALACCALLPFVARFFMEDDPLYFTLGLVFLLYLFAILISGNNMRQAVKKTIELRFENRGLVADLTEKNNQAEQAREDAEQANFSKSKFLAAASHDLRQPLHALGLFVDALDSRISHPEVRGIVDNIKISTESLASLFNALLDISKLDAGVLEPKVSDIPLRPLLQHLQTDYSMKAENKGIKLRIADCGYVVRSDPAMLERILLNLLSNAIRYTKNGGVLLGCRRRGEQVNIEIYDSGIGISSEEIEKVFNEFYQVANPERDRRKGLGLGLAIVKRSCDLLGHSLEVNSVPGKGTVFRVTVPLVSTHASNAPVELIYTDDIKNARVLIIDDEAMIRTGMRSVLQQWGCQVFAAESADQALQLLLAEKIEPDIILSDYRLREDKTGIEAIDTIRQFYNREIPAIIITGDTAPDRLREAKASGFHLLNKPVSSAKLRSLICYLLENSVSN